MTAVDVIPSGGDLSAGRAKTRVGAIAVGMVQSSTPSHKSFFFSLIKHSLHHTTRHCYFQLGNAGQLETANRSLNLCEQS